MCGSVTDSYSLDFRLRFDTLGLRPCLCRLSQLLGRLRALPSLHRLLPHFLRLGLRSLFLRACFVAVGLGLAQSLSQLPVANGITHKVPRGQVAVGADATATWSVLGPVWPVKRLTAILLQHMFKKILLNNAVFSINGGA